MSEVIKYEYGPNPEPYSIKIERGQKGGYGWEISVKGSDPLVIIEKIRGIDTQLRAEYCGAI